MTWIRLGDWRDRGEIQGLRRMLHRPLDGGLYELLNWPMYHTHIAVTDNRVVGLSSVILLPSGVADDIGTIVIPEYRRKYIASSLRGTQARDLLLMGYHTLYCAAPLTAEASAWCQQLMGDREAVIDNGTMPAHGYYRVALHDLVQRLHQMSIPAPVPLSAANQDRLYNKAQRAIRDSAQLQALGDFNMRKAMIRDTA